MESFLPQAGIEMCYDQLGHRSFRVAGKCISLGSAMSGLVYELPTIQKLTRRAFSITGTESKKGRFSSANALFAVALAIVFSRTLKL
jgi:hypothetical protein